MSKRRYAQYLRRGYLLPETVAPEDHISVCVPVPNDPNHIRAFLGQLDMLGYWYTWTRDSSKQGTLAARVWRDVVDIVRQRINDGENCEMVQNCCVETTVVLHRVNPQTGRLEISTDDGAIWTQDPQDPGVSATQFPPPVTSGAAQNKCNAAANAKANVQDWVEGIVTKKEAGGNLLDFVVAVAVIVLSVFAEAISGGLLTSLVVPILMATMVLVYNMLTADWEAYWTNAVYDSIVCAFYCAMNADGSIDQAGYTRLIFKLALYLPSGTPKQALFDMIKARGLVGVNNMATFGTGTADCSNCTCEACGSDWAISSRFGAGGSPVGTLVSKGLDEATGRYFWEIASNDDGSGDQAVFMSSGITDGCCNVSASDFVITAGTEIQTTSFVLCDHALTDFQFGWIGNNCINSLGLANEGNNPFTVKIFFNGSTPDFPCPPEI